MNVRFTPESGRSTSSCTKVRFRPKADINAVVMGLGELAAFFGTKKVTAYPNPNSQPC